MYTDDGKIQDIYEQDVKFWPKLLPFIKPAESLMRTVVLVYPTATAPFYNITDADHLLTLTEVETWLAAHFAAVADPRTQQEQAGSVSATYEGKSAMHLDRTRYGQTAMVLDASGALAEHNAKMSRKLAAQKATTTSSGIGIVHLGK